MASHCLAQNDRNNRLFSLIFTERYSHKIEAFFRKILFIETGEMISGWIACCTSISSDPSTSIKRQHGGSHLCPSTRRWRQETFGLPIWPLVRDRISKTEGEEDLEEHMVLPLPPHTVNMPMCFIIYKYSTCNDLIRTISVPWKVV